MCVCVCVCVCVFICECSEMYFLHGYLNIHMYMRKTIFSFAIVTCLST